MSIARFLSGFFERNTYHRLLKYRTSEQFVRDETRRAKDEAATPEIRAAHLILKKSCALAGAVAKPLSLAPAEEAALVRETASLIGALIPVAGCGGVPLEAALGATLRAERYASADLTGEEKTTDRTTSEYRQCFLAGQEKKAFSRFVSRAKEPLSGAGLTADEAESLVRQSILKESELEAAAHGAAELLGKAH